MNSRLYYQMLWAAYLYPDATISYGETESGGKMLVVEKGEAYK